MSIRIFPVPNVQAQRAGPSARLTLPEEKQWPLRQNRRPLTRYLPATIRHHRHGNGSIPILSAILFSTIFGLVTILFIPDDRPKLVISLAYAWWPCSPSGSIAAYDTQKGGLHLSNATSG